ncbi:hypothetical protein [Autumnicola edwardsiae]|uniref:Uncharacterized protein n=1 Tax=Autumnicola edwardsiae TaxID=3075594 RepID=A0ABU3CS08_9FLAO|nr:hypothetical protein [Zunongwangia sp. F297]MDT0649081.1 hypothetical protein [Zunongwangia sp. F297]
MNKNILENINDKYLSKKDKSKKPVVKFRTVEDRDFSLLGKIAAEGTKKGFERAKKVAHEIVIVQNGKLIRKKPGKPNQIISKIEERQVEIGKTISL